MPHENGEYILNVNDGIDTLHRKAGLTERCNTDAIEGRMVIQEHEAESKLLAGDAVACKHCIGDAWG
jgi:hypothetical protein